MSSQPPTTIHEYFSDLSDPRGQNVQHPLLSIITIALCGTLCGADNWVDIEMYGHAKREWLATFLDLPHGIPSHDTFGRVFRQIDPDEFQRCFHDWTMAICELTAGEVVAIDGKQVRRSKDGSLGQEGIYMVSVWASENRLVLGQEKVDDHSNEITAIPKLLRLLDLAGSIITIDAMGCQTDIAQAIMEQEADYVIAVKGNQGMLLDDVVAAFESLPPGLHLSSTRTIEKDHGRIEIRECWVTAAPAVLDYIQAYKAWPGLHSLVKIVSERRLPDKTTLDTRYFIASLPPDASHLLQVVRTHWHIENRLHWVLDIAFREDDNRVRKDHAPQNLAVLRHIALNLLKQDTSLKVGIKAKRLRAGWDQAYLLQVLCAS
jgi:predicted transposase YbfD/YdcC